jgi:hypothetical protein
LFIAAGVRAALEPFLLPSPAARLGAVVGLRTRSWKAELSLGTLNPEAVSVPGGGSAQASLIAGGLRGCYGRGIGMLRLWWCGGAEAGRFAVAGEGGAGLLNARTQRAFWFAALAGAELSWPLTSAISVGSGAEWVVAPRSIRVERSNIQDGSKLLLYSTRTVDIRPWVGLDVVFR